MFKLGEVRRAANVHVSRQTMAMAAYFKNTIKR